MTEPDTNIPVVLADDQDLVRMGLRALIDSEPDLEVVAEVGTGRAAVSAVRRLRPRVALLDIRMPDGDGLTALREIAADPALSEVRVVMLTTFELDDYVFAAVESGAAGFLVKDSEPAEILRAIRVAAAGESLLSPSVTRTVIERLAARTDRGPLPDLSELTGREREVLGLIGAGLNNSEIAAQLWIAQATARTHVSHIMLKLAARDRPQLVVIAHRAGLV